MTNRQLLISLILLTVGMTLLAFASVPLYSIFCKTTGYGGTTSVGGNLNRQYGNRTFIIKFDSNVEKALPWKFKPMQKEVSVRTGETALVFYEAENTSETNFTGMSVYNVTPHQAGNFFNKIHCFCFEEQTLKAGEKVIMPVSFYIDKSIEDDPLLKDVNTITLSYSFFKIR